MKRLAPSSALIALMSLSATTVHAAGYAINDQGARAMGQGLAVAATLTGPENLFYNPAGIAEMGEGRPWEMIAGTTLLLADFSAVPEETGTQRFDSEEDSFLVPHFAVTHRLSTRWSLGVGLNAPFGLATSWADDFPGRFLSRHADLKTVQLGVMGAVRLPRGWSLGFGPTLTHGDVQLIRDVDLSAFQRGHQAEADLTGDGNTLGYRIGARWRGESGWAFGVTWHGETDLDLSGDVDYTVPLLGIFSLDQALLALFGDGPASTTLTLPAVVNLGIGRNNEKWSWGLDFTWTHWSVMDSVVIDLQPVEVEGQFLVLQEFLTNDWDDAIAIRFGARRHLGPRWSWSAGAYFDETPVPVRTADPLLPDSDRLSVTGGLTWTKGRFSLDAAAQVVHFDELDTKDTENEFPSAYDASVIGVAFTAGWRWGDGS